MKRLLVMMGVVSYFFLTTNLARGGIIGCGHPEYPPFMWKSGDKVIGLIPEVARIVFERLGINAEFRAVGNWKRCLKMVEYGEVDLLTGAYITEERKKFATYVKTPIIEDPLVIFVWRGNEFHLEEWDDLIGKRMGSTLGDSKGEKFDRFLAERMHPPPELVESRVQNYKKLESGRIDFITSGLYPATMLLKMHGYSGRIIPIYPPIKTEYLHLAVSRKSKYHRYLSEIDKELRRMQAKKEISGIIVQQINRYISMQK